MPDQSSAADEHALIQEITAPLASLPDDPLPIAADVNFPVVLRGYDRVSVDAYVRKTSQLVAELQATRSPEAAVRRALERVGEQISGILQRAHDTAGQITTQSRREAEDRLDVARHEAAQITAAAEQRLKELDGDTDRIWGERQRILEDTRQLSRELMALAETAAEQFPAAGDTGTHETATSAPGEIHDFTGAAEADSEPGLEGEPALEGDQGLEAEPEPAPGADPALGGEQPPMPEERVEPASPLPARAPDPDLDLDVDPDATAAFAPVEPRPDPDDEAPTRIQDRPRGS